MFFFEKKNQKTLDYSAAALSDGASQCCKSFLVLFFKKEPLSLLAFVEPAAPASTDTDFERSYKFLWTAARAPATIDTLQARNTHAAHVDEKPRPFRAGGAAPAARRRIELPLLGR
jgi:hypothetical protein